MIDKDLIVAAVKEPMRQYCQTMKQTIGDWQPLLVVSEKILAGGESEMTRSSRSCNFW